MNSTLKRKKSITSQAASISAWCAVFDWLSIVAPTSVERHGPASSSAARRKTAARSSQGSRAQSSQASADADTACSTSPGPALCTSARTWSLSCGMTASNVSPVRISSPPITSGISSRSPFICSTLTRSSSRSGDPGAYSSTGSFRAGGGRKMPGRLMAVILRFGRWCVRSPTRSQAGGSASSCWWTTSWPGTSCLPRRAPWPAHTRWSPGSAGTSAAPGTGSRTSSSTSTGARRSSVRPWTRCARSRTATSRPTGRSRRSPGIRTRSGRWGRSAPRTASGSSCRATASWPQAGSGRTARSGPGTRSGCWSSRVSFSEDVRAELAAIAPERECDRLAELSALFHFAGRMHLLGRGEVSLHLDLSSPAAARRAFALLRSLGVRSEIRTYQRHAFGRETRYQLHVEGSGRAEAVLREAGVGSAALDRPPKRVVARACCRAAYLRGALLGGGTLSGPRSPHLEIRSAGVEGAEFVAEVARRAGVELRVLDKGRHAVAYAKGAAPIADALAAAGASAAVLVLEEHVVMGETKARANRLANADHANLVRTSRAAQVQIRAIQELELDELPDELGEIARLRLRHPSLSLRELALRCSPPATKSAAQRRLASLVRLAELSRL